MKITTSQVFQIGAAILGLVVVILPFAGLDPKMVAVIGGAVGTTWATVGGILTTPNAQINAVVANKDAPQVQTALVKAVASYPGVSEVQTNAQATPALIALAADTSQPKVLVPKS